MTTQHTPTPWHTEGASEWINSKQYSQIARTFAANPAMGFKEGPPGKEAHANAAFIVRAVNSHAALVEALGMLAMAARTQADYWNAQANARPAHDPERSNPEAKAVRWDVLYKQAATALAQAKESP